jgi:hypothetical protein
VARERKRIGGRPDRYSFLLNPHPETRLSRCPLCEKLTHPRKFALFIHIDGFGPLVLGKTCRYCTPCELIIAHQDELEAELAHSFDRIAPEVVGNPYMVLGTMDRGVWEQGLATPRPLGEAMEYVAEFKKYFDLHYEPGGWGPADGAR